jgi:hypothetical protein
MKMNVINRLPTITVAVDHQAIASLSEILLSGQLRRHEHHFAHQLAILWLQIIQRGDMPAGHHQQMRRRLRIDVAQGYDVLVLKHFFTGNCAGDNLTKNAIDHF